MTADLKELEPRLIKALTEHGALAGERQLILSPYGTNGLRASIIRPVRGTRSIQTKTVSAEELTGSLKDQVNGIVGRLLALPEPKED